MKRVHHAQGEGGDGRGSCTRDRKQRKQCIYVRFWQVNTGREHSEALMWRVAGRRHGPELMSYSYRQWHTHLITQHGQFQRQNLSHFKGWRYFQEI